MTHACPTCGTSCELAALVTESEGRATVEWWCMGCCRPLKKETQRVVDGCVRLEIRDTSSLLFSGDRK